MEISNLVKVQTTEVKKLRLKKNLLLVLDTDFKNVT